MATTELRRRIEEVWDQLPSIFTVRDVCLRIGLSDRSPTTRANISKVLDGMVDDGLLFPSLVLGETSGRRPSAWSKQQDGLPGEVMLRTVREVLPRMPRHFTLDVLLDAIGTSRRFRSQVRDVLRRLEDAGVVARVTERSAQMAAGRPPTLWSADQNVIASEMAFKAARAAQQREIQEGYLARLDRLLKPFDPFGSL